MIKAVKKYNFSLIILLFSISLSGQNSDKEILNSYESYANNTKELIYLHLNKSIFIKNETLGFTGYVFDKANKTPLSITKNLYCTITDEKGKIIKEKLLKVDNGITYNTIEIDSSFTSGNYTIRAFTNWMLNFKERNYFEQTFRVLDPEIKSTKQLNNNQYTIQAFPEGGHLVEGTINTLGIIVKNEQGIGLQNTSGEIIDDKNNVISEFTLSQFGIARASLIPKPNTKYQVVVNHNSQKLSYLIKDIKENGISLSVKSLRDKIGVTLQTNEKTLKNISENKYLIAIHNGSSIKMTPITFDKDLKVSKIFNLDDLSAGINIITIFDEIQNKPILERLFFNQEGIQRTRTESITTKVDTDSIGININFKNNINRTQIQNLSISVLPKTTKSYTSGSSIISQLYLEPYVRGFIQNADYYFSNTNAKKLYDLDQLLITQGWSSYEWGNIFDKRTDFKYKFEQGINVVANIEGKVKEGFLVYPLINNSTKIFNPSKEDKAFIHTNLYPLEGEFYRVSLLKSRDRTSKPNLNIEYFPNSVPEFKPAFYKSKFQGELKIDNIVSEDNFSNIDSDVEVLKGITIESKKEETRIERIKSRTWGKVDFFTDNDSKGGATLATYLSSRGWIATDLDGTLTIINPNPNTPNNNIPLLILDGVFISDFSMLFGFSLSTVDYIESNKTGIGYGIRGAGGVINIVTDPVKRRAQIRSKNDVASFDFPLTFDAPKKYYTPTYKDYNSNFFKEYGVIDWLPNLKINESGEINFSILNTFSPAVNLYIEGYVNGKLISEVKTIYPYE